ncbi:MAG: TRAP transporter substrate-binding protein [Dongiaceae bacterium]
MTALALGFAAAGASAQDYQAFKLNFLGGITNLPQTTVIERPAIEGLPRKSAGRIDVRYRTFQEVGLQGPELLRLATRRSFDIVYLLGGYASGDAPFLVGADLPGVSPSLDEAKSQADAYREVLDRFLQEQLNVKLLTLWPYPHQYLYCREPVTSLDQLNGKRIRVHSSALATLVKGLGASALTMSIGEVYSSLQRGVIDCATNSSVGGNALKWFEVSNTMVAVPLGWAMNMHLANKNYWDSLEPSARSFLEKEMAAMEAALWDMARDRGIDALNCNIGAECKSHAKAAMKLYRLTPAEESRVRSVVSGVVLPEWAAECTKKYQPCATEWNRTVGKAAGILIKP